MDNSKNLWIAIAAVSIIANIFFALNLYSQKPIGSESFLYIQDAATARLDALEGGTYELSMLNSTNTLTFSDRPKREFGSLTSADFVMALNAAEGDPPNAVLQVVMDGETRSIPVELMQGMAGDQGNAVSYEVKLLPSDGSESYLDVATLGASAEFLEGAALFVDAFPTSVNNQITDSITQANGTQASSSESENATAVQPQITD